MPTRQQLYEGKAKIIYGTDQPHVFVTYFKDDATAFNAQKRGTILGKGEVNCKITNHLFQYLEANGIKTHWLAQLSDRELQVKAVTIVPLEVVVRNIAAGSLCKQTGIELGTRITPPLVEFYYKNDALHDPLLTLDRLQLLKLATPEQVVELRSQALQINQYLSQFFQDCGITLVDFKLEFGLDQAGQLLLADEISPDTCRLWDVAEPDPAKRVLDKDRFRQDLGDVESAYQRVLAKV
ncbi:MAG: phosphoribosylaminoimidazolesuccinocarboxamide synthase, partial [Cyanobacteria bacterium P01_H01_bin.121]